MPEEYTGRISRVRFRNDEGFCIFELNVKGKGSISCKGTFIGVEIRPHMDITVRGVWGKAHPRYGRPFMVKESKEIEPTDINGITRYLKDNAKGVGHVAARKVAEHFGEDTVEILTTDASRIYECQFLTDGQREAIYKAISENVGIRDLGIFLQSFDVSDSLVKNVWKRLGNQAVQLLVEDPYLLMTVRGVGFKKADAIATRMGIDSRSPVRIRAVIRHLLDDIFTGDGHLYATRQQLTKKSTTLLDGVPRATFWTEVENLVADGKVVVDHERVYSTRHFNNEVNCAMALSDMLAPVTRDIDVEAFLEEYDRAHNITLSPEQRDAVRLAWSHKVIVITGGPGTGKTTIVRAVVGMFNRIMDPNRISLMAPTGIAAKRLAAATGRQAGTIHRSLGCRGDSWVHNEDNPLQAAVVVVDEASMIDQSLFNRLLRGIRPDATLVLVGDVAQLPSVGPGKVLDELLTSGVIPSVRLTTIHRQEEASDIVINAHRINAGESLLVDNKGKTDTKFIHSTDSDLLLARIRQTARALHTKGYDFQVLSPRHSGTFGVQNLNDLLRDDLNPDRGQPSMTIGYKLFRVGDRVMVTRNNYTHNVFNGDIGQVIYIDKSTIQFQVDGNPEPTSFNRSEANDLVLAYCITIHKSQGSEWDVVIMPMMKEFTIQLVRNLLYTGYTRGKKKVLVYGQLGAAEKAIRNNKVRHRNTHFGERLRVLVQNVGASEPTLEERLLEAVSKREE